MVNLALNIAEGLNSTMIYMQKPPKGHSLFSGKTVLSRKIGKHSLHVSKCATHAALGGAHAYAINRNFNNLWEKVSKDTYTASLHSKGTLRYFIDDRLKYYFGKMKRSSEWKHYNWPICLSIDDTNIVDQGLYGPNADHTFVMKKFGY